MASYQQHQALLPTPLKQPVMGTEAYGKYHDGQGRFQQTTTYQPSPFYPSPSPSLASPEFHKLDEGQDVSGMVKQNAKLKSGIRVLRFFLRVLSLLLSGTTMSTMILTLVKFYQTRHTLRVVQEPSGPVTRGPWALDSSVWSTYLLLATSVITFIGNLITLASYCKGVKSANRANDTASTISYIIFAIHALAWVATAAAYRVAKNGSDLWGWSCKGQGIVELQESFQGVVNFRKQCRVQGGSWIISVLEAIVGVLAVIIFGLAYKRLSIQRKMGTSREGRMSKLLPTRH